MAERINQHLNPIVGSNIRRLRKERGMKATEVIARLQLEGVYVTTGIFSKVEHGLNNPSVDMLVALTGILESQKWDSRRYMFPCYYFPSHFGSVDDDFRQTFPYAIRPTGFKAFSMDAMSSLHTPLKHPPSYLTAARSPARTVWKFPSLS